MPGTDGKGWYLYAGGSGGGNGDSELETDAFLVDQNQSGDPTPIESVTPRRPGTAGTLVDGVAVDGGGGVIVGGVYHPVDPGGPILAGLAVFNAAKSLQPAAREVVQIEAMRAISAAAQSIEQELGAKAGAKVAAAVG